MHRPPAFRRQRLIESGPLKRLIVNADDYGLAPGVSSAILHAHLEGIVSAASAFVNLPGLDHASDLAAGQTTLDIGLHLNFTWGRPCSPDPLPQLAPDGRFRTKRGLALALSLGRIPRTELRRETEAQMAAFRRAFGAMSHLDVHQHLHAFPGVWKVVLEIAVETHVPYVRFPSQTAASGVGRRVVAAAFRHRKRPESRPRTADHFRGLELPDPHHAHDLVGVLATLPEGLTELMVHPGDGSADPEVPDRLRRARARSTAALCAPEVREALDRHGIRLTTFRREAGLEPSPRTR